MSEYPEHDKLAADKVAVNVLRDFWSWTRNNQVQLCKRRDVPETMVATCPDCAGTGHSLSDLSERQRQIVTHYEALEFSERPWREEDREAHDAAMAELKTVLDTCGECYRCRGEGTREVKLDTTRQELLPAYAKLEDLLLAYFDVNKAAYRKERETMFSQLREDAQARPQAAESVQA